jgi:hypothetical protein
LHIDCALHCDAATVREGLLHVLGGGITRVNRPEYPAPLGTALALRIVLESDEQEGTLDVRLVNTDGQQIAHAQGGFRIGVEGVEPGEETAAILALPFHSAVLPSAGLYSFEISLGDGHQASVPFVAGTMRPS